MDPTYSYSQAGVYDSWDSSLYFTAGQPLAYGCPAQYSTIWSEPSGVVAVHGLSVVGNYSTTGTDLGGVGQAQGIAYNSGNHLLYVASTPTVGGPPPGGMAGGAVVVLNGTRLVADVKGPTINVPAVVVFDPANGIVYAANWCSGRITMIQGTQVIGSIPTGLINPVSGTYDPTNGDVYIAGFGGVPITVIHDADIVGTIGVGDAELNGTTGMAFDPIHDTLVVTGMRIPDWSNQSTWTGWIAWIPVNQTGTNGTMTRWSGSDWWPNGVSLYAPAGLEYVCDAKHSALIAFDGTKFVGEVKGLASSPRPGASDPITRDFYSPSETGGGMPISIISAILAEGPATLATPAQYPKGISYIGETLRINATLLAIGGGNDSASVSTSPRFGINCWEPPDLTIGTFNGSVQASCVPTNPLNFSIWLNVTDSKKMVVSSEVQLTAYSPIAVGPIRPSWSNPIQGMPIWLNATVFGGSSTLEYAWAGLPQGCLGATGAVECVPRALGTYYVTVTVTDPLDGRSITSDRTTIHVVAKAPPPAEPGSSFWGSLPEAIIGTDAAIAATLVALVVSSGMRSRRRLSNTRRS